MTTPVEVTIDAIATYRITRLLLEDEITRPLRNKFFEKYPPGKSKFGYLGTCPWCISMYIGTGVVVARTIAPSLWGLTASALTFSAVAGIISSRV